MKLRTIVISILMGLFLANAALLAAGAQNAQQGQVLVNQPYDMAQPGSIVPPASMMPEANAAPYANMPYAAPFGMSAPAPFGACGLSAPLAAPCAAPVAACGPYTSGFTYSATSSSAFGPFTPPVAQATEQFYQYPGLTPFGAYPGAGYAAASGVGFDPATGYYGPYGAYTPLI